MVGMGLCLLGTVSPSCGSFPSSNTPPPHTHTSLGTDISALAVRLHLASFLLQSLRCSGLCLGHGICSMLNLSGLGEVSLFLSI